MEPRDMPDGISRPWCSELRHRSLSSLSSVHLGPGKMGMLEPEMGTPGDNDGVRRAKL